MPGPYFSPLRYPGGKRKLVPFIRAVVKANDLLGGCYVEPFAGGAAVALELLIEGTCSQVHINDISKPLHAFWDAALHHNDALCERITETEINMNVWRRQVAVLENPEGQSVLDLGFAAFFLNRTNFSGILKGGVIGGKQQDGKYKLDARFKKHNLLPRIRQIGQFAAQIELHNQDALQFLKAHSKDFPEKTLVYLDPPYYVKGKALYENYYEDDNHQQIAQFLGDEADFQWLVSYDNAPEIIQIYQDVGHRSYQLQYFANQTYKGEEVMFFGPELVIPEAEIG
jgi:DNA adenine methylase